MKRSRIAALAAGVALLAMLGVVSSTSADGDRENNSFRARLTGFEEVPAVSSTGRGAFTARIRGDAVDWELSYEGLEGTITTASHIHLGQKDVNGGVSVFFCSGGGQPPCTPGSGEFSGTFTAADVMGPAAQGVAPGEFAELIRAIRAGKTYANVHTNKHTGGEIRGQVKPRGDDDDDDDDED